jgi:crotonobetaine/carnitine-CoA ligase
VFPVPLPSTLNALLAARAASCPQAPFIDVPGEGRETYGEVADTSRRLAQGLASIGIGSGDAVIVMAGNSLAAIHAWFAINLAGGVEVAINTAYRGATLVHAIAAIRAKTAVVESQFLPLIAEIEEQVPLLATVIVVGTPQQAALRRARLIPFADLGRSGGSSVLPDATPQDIASVIYTSGTSGPAKPVLLTHAANLFAAAQVVRGLRLSSTDVYYCVHPLFHMAGKSLSVIAQMLAGGRLVLDRKFSAAEWAGRVTACAATVTVAHGPMIEMIHAQPPAPADKQLPVTRVLACPMPKRIAAEFEDRFGLRGIEAFGMTEIGIAAMRPIDEPLRPGSCGRIDHEHYELRIADPRTDEELPAGQVGQILIRAKVDWILMQGYSGMAESTVAAWRNLWFHTGDAGYVDAEGYLYFVDRLGDRIRRRAENISSYDIETAAMTYPGIAEAAAVGVPSEFESDDDVKLCAATSDGSPIDMPSFLRHLAVRLPHYMVPRYLEQVDRLPRTPTNKVRKQELRAAGVHAGTWDRKAHGIELREAARNG